MPAHHLVQFYGTDKAALVGDVARFVADGMDGGETVVLATNRERCDAILREIDRLRGEPVAGSKDARLVVIDSRSTLERLYVRGRLNANRFDEVIGAPVRELAARSRSHRLRVYGDLVDELWQRGSHDDAVELERYWNDLQAQIPFALYCAYGITASNDLFGAAAISSVLCEHSHIVSGRAAAAISA